MNIVLDSIEHKQVIGLLEEHLADMYATSPPESVHALDLTELKQPNVSFFTGWEQEQLMGCAAIKEINSTHAEI